MVNFIFSGFVIQLGPIQTRSPIKLDAEGEGLKIWQNLSRFVFLWSRFSEASNALS